jgi:hypothetical protein
MTRHTAWLLFRWAAICLVFSAPVGIGAGSRINNNAHAVAAIATQRSGLRCALGAGDVLAATERYRLGALDPTVAAGQAASDIGAVEAALGSFAAPPVRRS